MCFPLFLNCSDWLSIRPSIYLSCLFLVRRDSEWLRKPKDRINPAFPSPLQSWDYKLCLSNVLHLHLHEMFCPFLYEALENTKWILSISVNVEFVFERLLSDLARKPLTTHRYKGPNPDTLLTLGHPPPTCPQTTRILSSMILHNLAGHRWGLAQL